MARLLDLLTLLASPFAAAFHQEFGGAAPVAAPLPPAPEGPPAVEAEVPVAVPVVVVCDLTAQPVSSGSAEPAPAVKLTGHVSYHPEMGEERPAAEIEASLSHYGKHWFLRTPLELKGRGITRLETEPDHGQRRAGWHRYKVTERAFGVLSQQHRIVSEALL